MASNEITDTTEIAERAWDGHSEPDDTAADISATKEPEGTPFEFHVQMRGFTLREMDDLIVQAAAKLIVGNRGDAQMAKAIEAKCVELVNDKAEHALASVTDEIINAPMTPSFGDKEPVTMRDFIGLYGREYLTAHVDREGKPAKPNAGGWGSSQTQPRIEYLVSRSMDQQFADAIKKATSEAIVSIRNQLLAQHTAWMNEEKKRFSEALAEAMKGAR